MNEAVSLRARSEVGDLPDREAAASRWRIWTCSRPDFIPNLIANFLE